MIGYWKPPETKDPKQAAFDAICIELRPVSIINHPLFPGQRFTVNMDRLDIGRQMFIKSRPDLIMFDDLIEKKK